MCPNVWQMISVLLTYQVPPLKIDFQFETEVRERVIRRKRGKEWDKDISQELKM